MARLTDGKKTIEIKMYGVNGIEWSCDFYDVGSLEEIECENGEIAYKVENVDYCIEQASDWKNMVGDFADEKIAKIDFGKTIEDVEEEIENRVVEIEQ